jgi:ABC-type transport system involved in multi-copper enzyme maturation permease subunit
MSAMKYLAILKDSLREAIDTKVFYVMVALSLLVVMFLLTNKFVPHPGEEFFSSLLQGQTAGLDVDQGMQKRGSRNVPAQVEDPDNQPLNLNSLSFKVIQAKALDGADDSPSSTYHVTARVSAGSLDRARRLQAAPGPLLELLKVRLDKAEELDVLRARQLKLADASNPAVAADRGGAEATSVYIEFTAEPMRNTRRLWPYELQLFFGAIPLGEAAPLGLMLYIFASLIMTVGGWVTLIISVVLTAFFIPNMLRKGTVDLLIVKPIQRPVLLIYKYLGGLTFVFLNTTVAITGVWLALGLRSGIWANNFLFMIPTITFFFAILYAVSTFFSVISRSPIVAILVTCGAWFMFWTVGTTYSFVERRADMEEARQLPAEERWANNSVCKVIGAIHFITPRTSDLNRLGDLALAKDFLSEGLVKALRLDRTSITWGESITVSLVFIGLLLAASCWWFATTDY